MRGAFAFAVALSALAPSPATAQAVTVSIDAADELGPTNPGLRGVGWNTGPISGVVPLRPPTVRVDGSLDTASQGPDQLDLSALLDRVGAVRRTGAEPQVILSYMPPWLANTGPGDPRDPTRVAPSDFDAWQALVEEVVGRLATAPRPALRFEVWNEPDLPVFWQDTPTAWIELARRTHAGVAAVEERTGLELEVGGPATAFPDPAFIVPYVEATRGDGLPPDFVSWHFYGNHPFFGPDGNEGFVPDAMYEAGAHRNPFTTPREFGFQIDMVRSWVGDDVDLAIDEWNVAAGGFDTRHDTHEGAAFDAAVLIEMERAALDAADFYRASDDPGNDGRVGDWGLVDAAGDRKPAWWVFDAWRRTEGTRVGVSGDDPDGGFWARATKGGGRVDVVLASFAVDGGEDREVQLDVTGFEPACAEVRTIDGPDSSFSGAAPVTVDGSPTVSVPGPSVVWVRLLDECGSAAAATAGGGTVARGEGEVLPATGDATTMLPALVLVAVAGVLGRSATDSVTWA